MPSRSDVRGFSVIFQKKVQILLKKYCRNKKYLYLCNRNNNTKHTTL